MHIIRMDRHLPSQPRPRIDTKILQRNRQQANRHLLARRHNSVIFPRIMNSADMGCPFDQLIRCARHRRDHDRYLMAVIDLGFDALRDISYAIKISN